MIPDGTVVSNDFSESYPHSFSTVSDIDGFWTFAGKGDKQIKLWVDEFTIQIDAQGYFNIDYERAYTEDGQELLLSFEDCGWHTYSTCAFPIMDCEECGTPMDGCPCIVGSRRCKNAFLTTCGGDCPGTEECNTLLVPIPSGPPVLICACLPF